MTVVKNTDSLLGFKYPRLQIFNLKDCFANKFLELPKVKITLKVAARKGKNTKQEEIEL